MPAGVWSMSVLVGGDKPGQLHMSNLEESFGASKTPGRHRYRWYHTLVEKTTLYLPDDLKTAIKRAAAQRGISEAEVIRQSIRQVVGNVRPRPKGGLFSSGKPFARRADELLAGFGER